MNGLGINPYINECFHVVVFCHLEPIFAVIGSGRNALTLLISTSTRRCHCAGAVGGAALSMGTTVSGTTVSGATLGVGAVGHFICFIYILQIKKGGSKAFLQWYFLFYNCKHIHTNSILSIRANARFSFSESVVSRVAK
jgi:hypothetical protein